MPKIPPELLSRFQRSRQQVHDFAKQTQQRIDEDMAVFLLGTGEARDGLVYEIDFETGEYSLKDPS